MADDLHHRLTELVADLRVVPGSKVVLSRDFDPAFRGGMERKTDGADLLRLGGERLADCQDRLYAEATRALLVVIQGIDASGKDGTIRHVMSGVNAQGVTVHSFKVPSALELRHDYLWRYQRALPGHGEIAIFNRSQYEEVLVVRVHPELLSSEQPAGDAASGELWHRRYRDINSWERHLSENGCRVVKLFLNLSKEEQRRRFLKRIDRPDKNWKFSAADVRERGYWDAYQDAFSQMLSHTSTEWAPWHVIPADRKWFARLAAAAVIVSALTDLDPRYPEVSDDQRRELAGARAELEAEAPPGAPADPFVADRSDAG